MSQGVAKPFDARGLNPSHAAAAESGRSTRLPATRCPRWPWTGSTRLSSRQRAGRGGAHVGGGARVRLKTLNTLRAETAVPRERTAADSAQARAVHRSKEGERSETKMDAPWTLSDRPLSEIESQQAEIDSSVAACLSMRGDVRRMASRGRGIGRQWVAACTRFTAPVDTHIGAVRPQSTNAGAVRSFLHVCGGFALRAWRSEGAPA